MRGLSVVATSACNLSCSYCYRRCAAPRSLAWPDLRRTLDWALDPPGGGLEVMFTGGEPLLAPALLHQGVLYLRRRAAAGTPATLRVLSNGILLDEEWLAFLSGHDVHLNLSCDGVAAAQEQRGRGTWRRLDDLLAAAAARYPRWFETRLQVTATVSRANLPHLADSVDYLFGKGVAAIGLSPALTAAPGGDGDPRPLLAAQLERIGAQALRHYERTGRVPLLALRKHSIDSEPPAARRGACGALDATHPTLDVDGRLTSCLMFVPSGLDRRDPRLAAIARDLDLGRVGEAGLEERRRTFAASVASRELFGSGLDLHSSGGRCRDCPAAAVCRICPISLLSCGPEAAPRRVPALLCAFTRLVVELRRDFPVLPDPDPPRVTAAEIRALAAAARGSAASGPRTER
ncbi:MAG: radical SAM protein [Candidatus Krumholzibacteriia bacterium]